MQGSASWSLRETRRVKQFQQHSQQIQGMILLQETEIRPREDGAYKRSPSHVAQGLKTKMIH